jgi:hypothetical protein
MRTAITQSEVGLFTYRRFKATYRCRNVGKDVSLKKSKGVPLQAELTLGVPGRLRPRIISTFGTTRVVGRQPYAPYPRRNPWYSFSEAESTWFCRKEPRKKFPVTPPGIDSGTVRLVAQRLNHYATPGPKDVPLHSA